tara:strand:+ start:119 stop:652 length:534 start_codon:yes stop_codon:yes gene_type:complete
MGILNRKHKNKLFWGYAILYFLVSIGLDGFFSYQYGGIFGFIGGVLLTNTYVDVFGFFKRIQDIEELKNKILLTIGLIVVYRFMAAVPLPGIDPLQLTALKDSASDGGLLGLLNAFTGGAFARASVMALGIMPYISASIVVQLMGIAIPYLQKLQKDGESGRKKITQITRWLTIAIT